jgi:hypothetical protein
MAEQTTKPAQIRRRRTRPVAEAVTSLVVTEPEAELPRGRTAPLDAAEQHELLRTGVALFNGLRYWHAHEAWETLWRAASDEDRDFYQGLIQIAAGLLHLQRRNARGARNKLAEGLEKLAKYEPAHRSIVVTELVAKCKLILADLDEGLVPYLIPPVIRFVEMDTGSDFDR